MLCYFYISVRYFTSSSFQDLQNVQFNYVSHMDNLVLVYFLTISLGYFPTLSIYRSFPVRKSVDLQFSFEGGSTQLHSRDCFFYNRTYSQVRIWIRSMVPAGTILSIKEVSGTFNFRDLKFQRPSISETFNFRDFQFIPQGGSSKLYPPDL